LVRLYMDTMHGAVADTGYYMRENFDEHAGASHTMVLIDFKPSASRLTFRTYSTYYIPVLSQLVVQYVFNFVRHIRIPAASNSCIKSQSWDRGCMCLFDAKPKSSPKLPGIIRMNEYYAIGYACYAA
jgi:hypothetical protein